MAISEKLLQEIEGNIFTEESLDLSGQAYDDQDIVKLAKALKKNVHIKRINLSYNNIGDIGATAIAAVNTIQELDFHNGISGYNDYENHIGPIGATALAKSSLKKLNMSGNPIRDEGAIAFGSSTSIVELDLGGNCQVTSVGAKELFRTNTTLQNLSLRSNNIMDDGLSTLSLNHTLKELDLSLCKITHSGAQFIAQNNTLKNLQLNENNIQDEGAQALAQHPTLEYLALGRCGISDVGMIAFKTNPTIRELILPYNRITIQGVRGFCENNNSQVRTLDLGDNDIDVDEACLQYLASIPSLTTLSCENNKINEAAMAVVPKLSTTSSLQRVNFGIGRNFFPSYTSHSREQENPKRKISDLVEIPDSQTLVSLLGAKDFIIQANSEEVENYALIISNTLMGAWNEEHHKKPKIMQDPISS